MFAQVAVHTSETAGLQGAVINWHYFESHEGKLFSKEQADLGKL